MIMVNGVTPSDADVKEVCLCAAIKTTDGEVVRGHRHNNCYDVLRERSVAKFGKVVSFESETYRQEVICAAEQGFLTSRGRFVDRREGMALMRASGLRSWYREDGAYKGDELFSEDLYPDGPTT